MAPHGAEPPVGRREANKRATRVALRDAAITRFAIHGVTNTKISDIAADCGVSERTFFRYFTSKEQAALDPIIEWIEGIAIAMEDLPYGYGLTRTVAALVEKGRSGAFPFESDQLRAAMLFELCPEMSPAFGVDVESFRLRVIQRMSRSLGAPDTDALPRALGSALSAGMLGIIEAWLLAGLTDDLWDLTERVLLQVRADLIEPT